MSRIMTCDQEWSHEELYGVVYDDCADVCKKLDFLLDNPALAHPDNLRDAIMNILGDHNLVDKYDELYASKDAEDTSDDVFNKWDLWVYSTAKEILYAHKYKYYIGGK